MKERVEGRAARPMAAVRERRVGDHMGRERSVKERMGRRRQVGPWVLY